MRKELQVKYAREVARGGFEHAAELLVAPLVEFASGERKSTQHRECIPVTPLLIRKLKLVNCHE